MNCDFHMIFFFIYVSIKSPTTIKSYYNLISILVGFELVSLKHSLLSFCSFEQDGNKTIYAVHVQQCYA
jgi:xanthosine utilization system XapX-like protein